jgi:hypothetical protein
LISSIRSPGWILDFLEGTDVTGEKLIVDHSMKVVVVVVVVVNMIF